MYSIYYIKKQRIILNIIFFGQLLLLLQICVGWIVIDVRGQFPGNLPRTILPEYITIQTSLLVLPRNIF